jgi:hypothetical protein
MDVIGATEKIRGPVGQCLPIRLLGRGNMPTVVSLTRH